MYMNMLYLQYSNPNGCHNILQGGNLSYTQMCYYNCLASMMFWWFSTFMNYFPIEYNNYARLKLKQFICPHMLSIQFREFQSDLVKVSTCKMRNFLCNTWCALVVAVSDWVIHVCCFQFCQVHKWYIQDSIQHGHQQWKWIPKWEQCSNFHSMHTSLYFTTFRLIRNSNAYR